MRTKLPYIVSDRRESSDRHLETLRKVARAVNLHTRLKTVRQPPDPQINSLWLEHLAHLASKYIPGALPESPEHQLMGYAGATAVRMQTFQTVCEMAELSNDTTPRDAVTAMENAWRLSIGKSLQVRAEVEQLGPDGTYHLVPTPHLLELELASMQWHPDKWQRFSAAFIGDGPLAKIIEPIWPKRGFPGDLSDEAWCDIMITSRVFGKGAGNYKFAASWSTANELAASVGPSALAAPVDPSAPIDPSTWNKLACWIDPTQPYCYLRADNKPQRHSTPLRYGDIGKVVLHCRGNLQSLGYKPNTPEEAAAVGAVQEGQRGTVRITWWRFADINH